MFFSIDYFLHSCITPCVGMEITRRNHYTLTMEQLITGKSSVKVMILSLFPLFWRPCAFNLIPIFVKTQLSGHSTAQALKAEYHIKHRSMTHPLHSQIHSKTSTFCVDYPTNKPLQSTGIIPVQCRY